jgi:hypothetical protein
MNRTSSKATHADRHSNGRAGDGTTQEGGGQVFDWAALVPFLVHPLKAEIIEAMTWIAVPLSASDLTKILDEQFTLSHISYYIRELAKVDAIELAGSRKVRGATENFYRTSPHMLKPATFAGAA